MRTINSKRKHFSGSAIVAGENVFIDTSDGTGFPRVFELMEPYTNMLVNFGLSMCSSWASFDDIKQDVYVFILEGISKYNPNKGASLSTFLHKFVKNRLIDLSRKKDPLRLYCTCEIDLNSFYYIPFDPIDKIDLLRRIQNWDDRWRRIMFRLFINCDKVSDVAKDEDVTPWGLSRAVKKKLEESRK